MWHRLTHSLTRMRTHSRSPGISEATNAIAFNTCRFILENIIRTQWPRLSTFSRSYSPLHGIAEQSGHEELGGPFPYNTFAWKEAKGRRKQHVILHKDIRRHKECSSSRHLTDAPSPSTGKDCKILVEAVEDIVCETPSSNDHSLWIRHHVLA